MVSYASLEVEISENGRSTFQKERNLLRWRLRLLCKGPCPYALLQIANSGEHGCRFVAEHRDMLMRNFAMAFDCRGQLPQFCSDFVGTAHDLVSRFIDLLSGGFANSIDRLNCRAG